MSLLKSALFRASGSPWMRGLLERNAQISHYLLGIGSGAGTFDTGERVVFDLLRSRGPPPYCIFDVGANRGQFLELVRGCLGDREFAVHCFEPARGTFAMLASNPGALDRRVKINNVGLGREPGRLELHYDKVGSGLASLTKRKLDHFGIEFEGRESVEIDTVDRYCAAHGVTRLHVLKIDVEGHELDALHGAREMLATRSIDIVMFEFGGCNIDTRTYFRDFWYLFRELGMDIHRISPSGRLHPIGDYSESLEQFRTTNFVAVRTAS